MPYVVRHYCSVPSRNMQSVGKQGKWQTYAKGKSDRRRWIAIFTKLLAAAASEGQMASHDHTTETKKGKSPSLPLSVIISATKEENMYTAVGKCLVT